MNNFQRIFIIRIRSKSQVKCYVALNPNLPGANTHEILDAKRWTMREAVEWIGKHDKRNQASYVIEYVPLVRDTRSEYGEAMRMEARP
jgi:hypothetical protein